MTILRLALAVIFMLMAIYIVIMNWACVIASMRNSRNGIKKYHSTIPILSLIVTNFAYFAYPYKPTRAL